jgi:hypothetical protein
MGFIRKLLPGWIVESLTSSYRLLEKYGQRASFAQARCVDAAGAPIPWYTYPALEYLSSLNFGGQAVLEFGSGASSLWWARRAARVLSVEHDARWLETTRAQAPANLELKLATDEAGYVAAGADRRFDVIVIDGIHRARCAQALGPLMADAALVILDNSDWHPKTAARLRESYDLLQVDFHGFGPINSYTWTTSLFFSRAFRPRPLTGRLPSYSAAALKQLANEDD